MSRVKALAATCRPPAGVRLPHPESPLGLVEVNRETCTGCGNCARVCPTEALAVHQQDAGMELTFDPALCVGCSLCVDLCPEVRREAIKVELVTDIDALLAQLSEAP